MRIPCELLLNMIENSFNKRFAWVTRHVVVPPLGHTLVDFRRLVWIVELLAQVAPAIQRISHHVVVLFPLEIFEVKSLVLVQQQQILGQLFGRSEIGDVDVGMRRGVGGVIRTTVHHRNYVRFQGPVEFLADVIGAKGILGRQVKLVLVQQIVTTVAVPGQTRQIAAVAVHVDGHVLAQLANVILPPPVRLLIGTEPGQQFVLFGQSRVIGDVFHKLGRGDGPLAWRQSRRKLFQQRRRGFPADFAVMLCAVDVGISAVRHGPVEVIVDGPGEVDGVVAG